MRYPQEFFKAPNFNLWHPQEDEPLFKYSEGTEAENYLEHCLTNVSDLSCHSSELAECIHDWSSEYHLSPKRSNLLRPLQLNQVQSVLELGAGCGAITRYLGETTPKVIAIEGSKERAKIAALRCRDLDHVQVIHGNYQNLEFSEKFDIVTLIGALEYSGTYITSQNPYQKTLEIARSNLTNQGVLILAIENKLGLKYFAGCTEDHTGRFFDGIEGYCDDSVKTFGKKELEDLLKASGFEFSKFLYPFPDYKIPEVILRLEEVKDYPNYFLYQWLGYEDSRDYSHMRVNTFQEVLVAKQVEANGFLPQMSNSFLVIASSQEENIKSLLDEDCLAYKYNTMRAKEFMTQVTLKKTERSLVVLREPIYPELAFKYQETQQEISHNAYESTKWVKGVNLIETILLAIKTQSSVETLKRPLMIWYKFLTDEARMTLKSETNLPGNYVDCTPWNLIITPNRGVEYIDREWSYLEQLPIKFILFRGILFIYCKIYPWIDLYLGDLLLEKNFRSFLRFCLSLISCSILPEELDKYLKWEWEFGRKISLAAGISFDKQLDVLETAPLPLTLVTLKELPAQLKQTQAELNYTLTQLQQSYTQLQQYHTQLEQSHAQLYQTQVELHQTQEQLEQTQGIVIGMESSKFWKLRMAWFRLKQLIVSE